MTEERLQQEPALKAASTTKTQPGPPDIMDTPATISKKLVASDKPAPSLAQQTLSTKFLKKSRNGINFSLVSFDDRNLNLSIVDQIDGPASQYSDSRHLGKSRSAIAVLNGGFFTPKGSPLGQLTASGTSRGHNNPSSLGSGYLLWSQTKTPMILRREAYKALGSPSYNQRLQTGPMLAEKGSKISGLDQTNRRVRSFIAWDGAHHWCIGHASACSLAELSSTIAGQNFTNFKINTAINLDGGRSSDLWVSDQITSGGVHIRPFWNKPVRNFLILK